MLNRIVRLIIKEFLAIWRNPHNRIVLLVPPLMQLLVFSFAATHEVKNVRLGIYSEDRGSAARELISRFASAHRTFSHVQYFQDLDDVHRAIDTQDVIAVVHIGPTFSRDLASGTPAALQILLDGRRAYAAQVISGYIGQITNSFVSEYVAASINPSKPVTDAASIKLVSRAWFNPNLDSVWSTVPGLVGILTNLIALIVTSLSIAREKELGTFEQLLVSPLRPLEILIGKTTPAMVLGLGEGMAMVAIATLVFALPCEGSPLLLFGSLLVSLFSTIGIGLLISSLAKTQQQAFFGAFAFLVPAILLSGFVTPVENMPAWLRWAIYVNPIYYIILIVKGILLEGMKTSTVLQLAWPMVPIGLVTLVIAGWTFRQRLE